MYSKLIFMFMFSGLLLGNNLLNIGDLMIKTLRVGEIKGFSFDSMTIEYDEREDAKDIMEGLYPGPKYKVSKCKSLSKGQGCINIDNLTYE